MKLTKSKLKQIIREELMKEIAPLTRRVSDVTPPEMAPPAAVDKFKGDPSAQSAEASQWYTWAEEIRERFGEDWWPSDYAWPTVDASDPPQLVLYIPDQNSNATVAIGTAAMEAGAESVQPGGQDTTVINTGVKFDGSVHRDLPPTEDERRHTQRMLDADAIRMQREY